MTATSREHRTATREFELTDGKHCFAYGEVRYTYTVTPARRAVGWSNTMGGNYYPAEAPDVQVTDIEWRMNGKGKWSVATGQLADMLAEVPDAWFLEQIEEQEA